MFRIARGRLRILIIACMVVLASVVTVVSAVDRQARGLEFTVYTDKEEYVVGESIRMYAEYVNYGYDSVDMTFSNSAVAYFSVCDSEGSLVYAIPQTTLQWIVYETLEPGESLSGGCVWDQTGDAGELMLSPGSYTIFAWGGGWELDLSARTDITITA